MTQIELWDVLDENRQPTGRLHRRGETLPDGDYHLTVHVWTRRRDGKFLLTKRSANKTFPLMWETTAGSAVAGDDSLSAALREVREETGLILKPENGRLILTHKSRHTFADIWLFEQEFSLADVVLQDGETCDAKLATKEEILQMDKDETLVPFIYLQELMNTI
ncbi:MAG: NUDIX domain-containing protein [Ruminococcaceae bacterium]|nr:NUDIX domain-containing protein [Oscillospiraceae bacterium]